MAAERCRVGMIINGLQQYYQREQEQKRDGKWVAVPLFVIDPKQSTPMSEAMARAFVAKVQGLGAKNMWLEDCRDGRRIEVESAQPQFVEENRSTAYATLDDEHSPDAQWFTVKPVNRPNGGPMWLLKCVVPGVMDPQLIYEKDPLACLRRAQDLNFLQYGERAPAQEPAAAPATQNSSGFRRRPGDLR